MRISVSSPSACCHLKAGGSPRWKLAPRRHLAGSRQGPNQRLLGRLLALITAALGLTAAEQVHGGQVSASTCSHPKKRHADEERRPDCIRLSRLCEVSAHPSVLGSENHGLSEKCARQN